MAEFQAMGNPVFYLILERASEPVGLAKRRRSFRKLISADTDSWISSPQSTHNHPERKETAEAPGDCANPICGHQGPMDAIVKAPAQLMMFWNLQQER